ncbi:50S ribosome-binding GTPase [Modestobacter sp. VKM Ac-2979]|uniref:GTPase n=1 Tax=unclassified Modestobacter TaxID=2643866 RepID=UPI0022ABADD1|nr:MULTISPECIES: GTPase [unclassified Modestobacter]MCZ2811803.1 50S ribosome-binding GTPase [Modestobacter sp. VKM Ac-2979]MCZ2843526.1 50S ribosome-binding GTPase [Modestobacter sp. VKM Ac-2980]
MLFGDEPEAPDPWPALVDGAAGVETLIDETRRDALADVGGMSWLDDEWLSPVRTSGTGRSQHVHDLNAPMRVVLMGRTMAGKSSVLSALTGSHSGRIGDGRQRFSRDTFGAIASACQNIELVDTPGVGAHCGADDTEIALEAALSADVVVWINSSDSIQEESASALKLLGVIGKPIIVVVNCRQSLAGVGRLNLLKFPQRVFGGREGLLDEIKRHLAFSGVEPLAVVHVHALAAAAAAASDVDHELFAASRIGDLTEVLLREHEVHSEARRALRVVDGQRHSAEGLALALNLGAARLRSRAARDREMTRDVHARLNRLVRATGEAMAADVHSAVGGRRDWHLSVTDFGQEIQSHWADEVAALQKELTTSLEERLTTLARDVSAAIQDAEAEWTAVPPDRFALRDLAGFDAVWGNRLAKAGVGVAGSALGLAGGAWLGAQIGGALGLATGPGAIVTSGIGLVVGGIAGLAAQHVKSFADLMFLGKDGVLRKRREEVAKQVGPILDQFTQEYEKAIKTQLDEVRANLLHERVRSDGHCESIERLASRWVSCSARLHSAVKDLDRVTTSALLRIDRRERLARSVVRATRVPGVCFLAEFDDAAFGEAWLFPPDLGETLAGGRMCDPGGESVSALPYALGLVDAPVRLGKADEASAILVVDADLPTAITEAWADGLTAHVDRRIHIQTTQRANHP